MSMWSEMLEQPAVVAKLIERNRSPIASLRGLVEGCTHAMIAARGTSDNGARYAQYVWGARNRLSTGLAAPSLYGVYDAPPSLAGALVVGISQSGQSPDLIEVLSEARRQGRPTVTITNHPESPLARHADVTIDLSAGEELAVAATKTYTATLAAVAAISYGLAGEEPTELLSIPDLLSEVLADQSAQPNHPALLATTGSCVVIGRGFHMATAFEWALKLQELAQVVAQPFSVADFLHGPIAAVDSSVPVLMVAGQGPTFPDLCELAERLMADGVTVIAITDSSEFPATAAIPIPPAPEWLGPLVAAPALQVFSHAAAVARGHDPDAPRGLSKVTRTL